MLTVHLRTGAKFASELSDLDTKSSQLKTWVHPPELLQTGLKIFLSLHGGFVSSSHNTTDVHRVYDLVSVNLHNSISSFYCFLWCTGIDTLLLASVGASFQRRVIQALLPQFPKSIKCE